MADYRFQHRRTTNPASTEVLLLGEWGVEHDGAGNVTGVKIGDGVTAWASLPFVPNATEITALDTRVDTLESGTSAWVEPAVGTGWTIQGAPYEIPRYRLFNGFVTMQGLVLNNSGGALGPLDVIFTLPAGMRPRAIVNAVPFSAAGLEVAPTGEVRVNNSIPNVTFLSLTMTFAPDQ